MMDEISTKDLLKLLETAAECLSGVDEAFARYWNFDHSKMNTAQGELLEACGEIDRAITLTRKALGLPEEPTCLHNADARVYRASA